MKFTPIGVPVDELDLGDLFCLLCGDQIANEAYYADEFEGHFCGSCVEGYVNDIEQEAETHARAACRITAELPGFDAENEFRCSQEDYDLGMRWSNTPNSYLSACRHECTNYDDLIGACHKSSQSIADQVFYAAIRERTDKMVIAEITRTHPEVAHEFYEFDHPPY
ncbi:hypothetical protein Mal15_17920 [Stieleria maiorica]|uniref:Uncharacterized protein n=1 Tax=Stieleria maiorica TaxID=2795974 RepID=A0A5B9M9I3_9BACT|nr:hypothetical protein [Stieleria maiorica]QEF97748.1 hypothetical protein Mal15_17920 [Stieleria maiorica]